MEDGRIPKDVLYSQLASGSRRVGRPALRFKDHMQALHEGKDTWEDAAGDVTTGKRAASQFFSGKPEGTFCLSCTFIFRNERNLMKKSARVLEKLVSPGLPGLQVATRLTGDRK